MFSNRNLRYRLSLVVGLFFLAFPIFSQGLSDFTSTDPMVRMRAFYALTSGGTPTDDATKVALIGLLGRETAYIAALDQAGGNNENDEYATYYSDLASVVASLRDVRSVGALGNLIDKGAIITDALAALGPLAIDTVLAHVGSSDTSQVTGSVIVLKKILTAPNLPQVSDPVSLNKIRVALSIASNSSSPIARSIASDARSTLSTVLVVGDVNGDRKVDCADVTIVKLAFGKRAGQPGFDPRADTNLDGVVDVRDLAFVSQQLPAGLRCQ